MALLPPLSFSVPTRDICCICLRKCSKGAIKHSSFLPVSQYLKLDIRKIFNIKAERPLPLDEGGEVNVDVDVTTCQSCSEWRNAFYEIYVEYKKIQRKLDVCVKGLHDEMVNGEKNLGNVREYLKVLVAGTKSVELEKVKASIPEKFRRETIVKSSRKKCLRTAEDAVLDKKDTPTNLRCNEEVKVDRKKFDDFIAAEIMMERDGLVETEGVDIQEISCSPDVKNASDEEDDDPEQLMMNYNHNLITGNENQCYEENEEEDVLSFSENENMELELVEDEIGMERTGNVTIASPSASSSFSTTSTPEKGITQEKQGLGIPKFKCELCGKIVASRKNFELHQRRHAGEKPFECEYCRKTFRDTSNLRSHVLRYHRHYLFIKFKNQRLPVKQFKEALDTLIQSILANKAPDEDNSDQVAQGCELCKRVYTQRFAIEDHIVQRHYDVLGKSIHELQLEMNTLNRDECLFYMMQVMADGNTARMCGSCGQKFDSADALNMHVKVHIKVNLVRNSHLSSAPSSATSSSLIKLKMKCERCSCYFGDLAALTRHKRIPVDQGGCGTSPSKDTLFQCEHCGKCLNTVNSHRRHLLSLHRYQVFAKHLPPGPTPAEVEEVIKFIFESRKTPRGANGFPCFVCEKVITQYRKLSSHVLTSHFLDIVKMVKEGLLERGVLGKDATDQIGVGSVQLLPNAPGQNKIVEVIELDSDDDDDEDCDDDVPQVFQMFDDNGDEIPIENGVQVVSTYAGGRDVEYVMDEDANIAKVITVNDPQIKIEYQFHTR